MLLDQNGWTKAVGEQGDGLQLGWYGCDGSDGFDGSRGSDGVDGCDGVVVPSGEGIKVAQVLASKETEQFLGTSLRMTTAPRVSDGSISLRRVDQIAGQGVEGFPYTID